MNYRHAFHAGNFADVMKHAALADIITYLKAKDKPFRLIDTHAGRGLYQLSGPGETAAQADRTGEWRDGIARVLTAFDAPGPGGPEDRVSTTLKPYLTVLRALQPQTRSDAVDDGSRAAIAVYPGSPLIAARLMRADDRLHANEMHEEDGLALARQLAGDKRVRVTSGDGWQLLRANLPPPERRGLVLIDPPFEEGGELQRLRDGLEEGLRRFGAGIFVLWYPIKDRRPIETFYRQVSSSPAKEIIACELLVRSDRVVDRLNGCGLVVANPPFGFAERFRPVLAFLAKALGKDAAALGRIRDLKASATTTADARAAPRPSGRNVKPTRSRPIRRT